ncbi:MAG: NAD-dependent DNA ligase LigA, partial [Candidatus Electrothrix sp. MAN1_4]|nr:NAD-dependent DNA ligase LigA [Candidatus Electrothrix sp. MAN1_4]
PDIFRLQKEELAVLDGWGEKSADKLLLAIAKAKHPTLSRFIQALGIKDIGKTNSDLLARHFNSLNALMAAKKKEFLYVDGIGEQAAENLLIFFSDNKNRELIYALLDLGLTIENPPALQENSSLEGHIFLFTGKLTMSRDEAKQMVEKLGGKVVSQISKKVTYLVAGEKAGSKLKKAQEMGTTIVNEQEFLELVS